ncbi:MAG: lipid A export permease/ATP-binding protein MsbA [Deltaproteobacteria bacterium GWC2_56_8]|nr:MAG: lipid A export permease/ATP-binding protein MsbA [Deltaproteobacteria bacterium GWB2_55_19]OGP36523.1 MAG: lipid A export permease/ATP-binding protein MsbA [Deltaproteobacteria bacterium GWC2_56_8]HAO92346.1 lipid A export permease/ATP-binding protein MsbA [Deltaproteobacteria bacterium]
MQIYLRLLRLLPPYKLQLVMAFVCMAGFALSNGAFAYLIGPVMKFLFANETGSQVNFIPFDLLVIPREKMLLAIPLAIIVVAVVKGLSSYGQSFFMGYVGQGVIRDIRKSLYDRMLSLPVGFFTSTPTGTLVSRLTNDVNLLQTTTAEAMATTLKQSLTIIVLAIVVISLDWKLALAAGIALPLSVYPMRKLGKRMKKVSTQGQVSMGMLNALLHEAIAGIRIVKAFCMEGYESARFQKENERYTHNQVKAIRVRAISSPLMETVGAVGFAVTIWFAAYRISQGTLKAETFISFFASVIMFYQPIKALNGVNLSIQQGLAAASRIFEIMDMKGEAGDRGGREITGVNDAIEFRSVAFNYGGEEVLKSIDLKVKKGEVIAIVGSSGAGKTTFVNLIPRFYDVSGGSILVDGTDIRDLTLKSLRSQTGIVSQQVILFNDTVKRNIAYGEKEMDDAGVVRAAKAANAHDFIMRLPEGYETVIGEGGVRLSGGERQRLSIARAIFKNAPVLILDEATSALDTESELEVQRAIANLMEGRTTFVIAHRLSTVRNADRIIVLSNGRIMEMGRHEELLGKGGEYSRLYTMQFNG